MHIAAVLLLQTGATVEKKRFGGGAEKGGAG